jgi:hypothetical protein
MQIPLAIVLLVLAGIAAAERVPNAPHLQMRPPVNYTQDKRGVVHNSPSLYLPERPRLFDWPFLVAHGVYGASVAFDAYVTARNVGTCAVEGNPDLGRLPTSKAIAIHGATEVGLVVAADVAMKWLGRRG